jgi:PAS domain S-box-containing protein
MSLQKKLKTFIPVMIPIAILLILYVYLTVDHFRSDKRFSKSISNIEVVERYSSRLINISYMSKHKLMGFLYDGDRRRITVTQENNREYEQILYLIKEFLPGSRGRKILSRLVAARPVLIKVEQEFIDVIRKGDLKSIQRVIRKLTLQQTRVSAIQDDMIALMHLYRNQTIETIKESRSNYFTMVSFLVLISLLVLGVVFRFQLKINVLAELKALESETRFRTITEIASVAIYYTNEKGLCEYVNLLWQKHSGISMEQAQGHGWIEGVHPEDRDMVAKSWERMVQSKSVWGLEYRFLDNNKHVTWVHGTARAILDTHGDVKGYIGINVDITKTKHSTEKLKQQHQVTKTITDNAASCLFMIDVNGFPTFMNPAAQRVTGYTLEQIKDKPLHDSIHYKYPDGRPYHISECPLEHAQAELVEMKNYEDIFTKEDGSLYPVLCYLEPLSIDGKILGSVLEFQDITKRKKTENTLRDSLNEKEVLLREVHHRVKNNMQVISGLLHLQVMDLKKKKASKKIAIDALLESRNRIATMAQTHEKLYKSERLNRISLQDYIDDLINDLFSLFGARERGIEHSLKIGKVELTIEHAIPFGLILNELVTNSIKHAFPENQKGKISISVKLHPKGMVELVMKDDGVGVSNIAELQSGKTLGIRLIHSLTDQIGGKISFKQQKGTTVRLCFESGSVPTDPLGENHVR